MNQENRKTNRITYEETEDCKKYKKLGSELRPSMVGGGKNDQPKYAKDMLSFDMHPCFLL